MSSDWKIHLQWPTSQWESKIQSGKFGEELSQAHTTGFLAGFCCRGQISTVCDKTSGSWPNRCSLRSPMLIKYEQISNVIRTCLELSQTLWYFQTCLILSPCDLVMWATQWQGGTNPANHSADGIAVLSCICMNRNEKPQINQIN